MGLPYSRQINAAFEQVTPLVAAGFQVLRTTRDISLLLAVIQVLTVWLLLCILLVLVAMLYCLDPGLEEERNRLVTPWLRLVARIALWKVVKTGVSGVAIVGAVGWVVWRGVLVKRWVEDVEFEGNVDAERGVEDRDGGEEDSEAEKKRKGGRGKNKKK